MPDTPRMYLPSEDFLRGLPGGQPFSRLLVRDTTFVVGLYTIGSVGGYQGMVLDLFSVRFRVFLAVPPLGFVSASDGYCLTSNVFRFTSNGQSLWNQAYTLDPALYAPVPGTPLLNVDVLRANDAENFHIFMPENGQIDFACLVTAATPAPPAGSKWGVEVTGRLYSASLYHKLVVERGGPR